MEGQPKNRAPAPIQITTEQILRETQDLHNTEVPKLNTRFESKEELEVYQLEKRKAFEDHVRRQKMHIDQWLQYAKWEAQQGEFERARSIYERALEVDSRHPKIWIDYAMMEQKNKFEKHARNVYERATRLLPRHDKFWTKYCFMLEILGDVVAAREIYHKWMSFAPGKEAWYQFIKFEAERCGETANARQVYENCVRIHCFVDVYIKYAKWEQRNGQDFFARKVYERADQEIPEDMLAENLYIEFSKFEEANGEFDRCRAILQYGYQRLTRLLKSVAQLENERVSFEKRHGAQKNIEDVIANRRRGEYVTNLENNPLQYDCWFDLIELEKEYGTLDSVRDVFERAVACLPPKKAKQVWRRYIYFWIEYAVFEEMVTEDIPRARAVYKKALQVIPHEIFTFSKLWILAAKFELRHGDFSDFRKLLGQAIGRRPTQKILKEYINLELSLQDVDRARVLYAKYVELFPQIADVWRKFADFELQLEENHRVRSIYRLAIDTADKLDAVGTPMFGWEMIWKDAISFEEAELEIQQVRDLYQRLLQKTNEVKVWLAYGKFESTVSIPQAREIYREAHDIMRTSGLREQRVLVLSAWKDMESSVEGNKAQIEEVQNMFPEVKISEFNNQQFKEYVFPEEISEEDRPKKQILDALGDWRASKKRAADESEDEDAEDEDY
eukprot:TRINITY_DN777873_c0_g1_i1.p1 TRINITY_DN777873_c0_g1~~TRINITY_DN777873_c0_g1_i1.p1  ORF type:complete len:672 (-),score=135.79 TRINITY_DN777873_c0_g1_i1:143-2158(-)